MPYAEVSTYHYFFKALDVEAAERVLGSWACGSDAPGHVALDGKRLRGSAPAGHNGSKGVRRPLPVVWGL